MSTITHAPIRAGAAPAAADVSTLAELEARFRREGYAPGCPPQLVEESARADAHAVAHMRCGACGRRRLEYFPWHRGRAYRVLAGCTACGAAEEV